MSLPCFYQQRRIPLLSLLLPLSIHIILSLVPCAEASDSYDQEHCGLFMAESAIPNAGWGMFTGRDIAVDEPVYPLDVAIQVADLDAQMKLRKSVKGQGLPAWLLEQYYWMSSQVDAVYDAKHVQSILPGLGMLANSHTGLVNVENDACRQRPIVQREDPDAGAYTHYQNLTFTAGRKIPAGHELFVRYGDSWFQYREDIFGDDLPLSNDFRMADRILREFSRINQSPELSHQFGKDLWQLFRVDMQPAMSARVDKALPKELDQVPEIMKRGTARHSVPNVVRSREWLEEHGLCLDNIEPRASSIEYAGQGAYATRPLKKGSLVAPMPVVHLHRGHLELRILDDNDKSELLWEGHQLLLNYLYGHPESSVVLFPYAPAVNLINHSADKPNVKLQWSDKQAHPEWLNLTTNELLELNDKAGLMMELVALRDIQPGEEVFLDYGPSWQQAWDKHVKEWEIPSTADSHIPIDHILEDAVLPTISDNEPAEEGEEENLDYVDKLPANAMVRCWLGYYLDEEANSNGEIMMFWSHDTDTATDVDEATECKLLHRELAGSAEGIEEDLYTVEAMFEEKLEIIYGLPRQAITILDKEYTGNQYLRKAFRHEIHLPDEMVPESWRDLKETEETTCQFYMAESSIPNSGLGMFTAVPIAKDHGIFYPEIVIQADDVDLNHKLRRWYLGLPDDSEPLWLIENYYWTAANGAGEFEADDVESVIPGVGMLANSHTGLYNAVEHRPFIDSSGLSRDKDPGAGASTYFHGQQYRARFDLAAGSEIFAKYGDDWFEERDYLAHVPLENDFIRADELLSRFWKSIGENPDSEKADKKWEIFWNNLEDEEGDRVAAALPRELKDVQGAVDIGTAAYSLPGSTKSIEWLQENGRCLDNIKSGMSTIPQAGRGAFATRSMSKGEIIAPAPLVHLQRRHMEVYASRDTENPNAKIWYERQQLLRNYCYGHSNSTILLFPYSPSVNYINHNLENYNAELRWSSLPNHRSDFFEMSVDDIMKIDHAGLIMEVVATRDIQMGEEIFLNYGSEWQEAWDKHVSEWEPNPKSKKTYWPAHEMNDFTVQVKTEAEQAVAPYPENIMTVCYVGHGGTRNRKYRMTEWGKTYEWKYFDRLYAKTEYAYPCDVAERHDADPTLVDSISPPHDNYTVVIYVDDKEFAVEGLPRRAIEFFDRQYHSDQYMPSAFRHEIMFPQSLLPDAWKDRDSEDDLPVYDGSADDDDEEEASDYDDDEVGEYDDDDVGDYDDDYDDDE